MRQRTIKLTDTPRLSSLNGHTDPLSVWDEIIAASHKRLRQLACEQKIAIEMLDGRTLDKMTVQVVREYAPMIKLLGIPSALNQSLLETYHDLEDYLSVGVIEEQAKLAGKRERFSLEEDEAFWAESERQEQEAREKYPSGYEALEIQGVRAVLRPLSGGWWLAEVPSLPDFHLQGETKEEAKELITISIKEHLEEQAAIEKDPNGYEALNIQGFPVLVWPLPGGWWLAEVPGQPESRVRDVTKQEAIESALDWAKEG